MSPTSLDIGLAERFRGNGDSWIRAKSDTYVPPPSLTKIPQPERGSIRVVFFFSPLHGGPVRFRRGISDSVPQRLDPICDAWSLISYQEPQLVNGGYIDKAMSSILGASYRRDSSEVDPAWRKNWGEVEVLPPRR